MGIGVKGGVQMQLLPLPFPFPCGEFKGDDDDGKLLFSCTNLVEFSIDMSDFPVLEEKEK